MPAHTFRKTKNSFFKTITHEKTDIVTIGLYNLEQLNLHKITIAN